MVNGGNHKDHWSAEEYETAASFVPVLTKTVLSYLQAAPASRILDIGCGSGQLTAHLASLVPQGYVVGLDSSISMIAAAKRAYASATYQNLSFHVHDCTQLSQCSESILGAQRPAFDRVFSNAALHWILRHEETRGRVFADIHDLLNPGGLFVFEMGGAGNVAEVHTALVAALSVQGINFEEAREMSPWFFPSDAWVRQELLKAGFEVVKLETEYRPTKLAEDNGLEGWVRLMGAEFLEKLNVGKRDEAVRWMVNLLRAGGLVTREGQDGEWLGYVRLRAVACKIA